MDLDAWRRQNLVNLDGVFLGTKAAIPLISASGGGSIVNMSSVAGLKGVAGLSGYCASKGGVRLFTKAVALECAEARNKVRVNSIHPGAIETPIWVKMLHGGVMPPMSNSVDEIMTETRAISARVTPMGSPGAPEDIAEGVVYLCSDAARFVTGAELVIDGGVYAG
jgi:NAD(P)-dependent dehydrogenase (short-subunit alcohol dehydrogenase family)